jgi:hypothetical protein
MAITSLKRSLSLLQICLYSYSSNIYFYVYCNLVIKIEFWDNVYGFNMGIIKDIALAEPLVDIVDSNAVISNAKPVLSLDVMTCTKEVNIIYVHIIC